MNDKIEKNRKEIEVGNPCLDELLEEFEDDEWADYIPEEDPERSVSNQEIINALEECIIKLEKFKGKKQTQQIVKTLILVCKILSVELNKSTHEGLGNIDYVS